ncbi:hypothetical protein OHAE_3115 [Ochrobactrum soli]|uniref:Uncharacterized protein n=1 Tax=Ochrobactrum soli TaxID=2448455 RepID=A0A2P9HGH7_9HYPH|nr:hypothetical protein OHAE_3115 [[Ochrobactrum] soli]
MCCQCHTLAKADAGIEKIAGNYRFLLDFSNSTLDHAAL